jgi:hypothetical protein
MELSKKPGLVFFATQPGATFENFDASRCRREVILPAQEVLLQENLLHTLLLVISCDKEASVAEGSEKVLLIDDGLSRLETPTSRELLKSMRKERSEQLFEYLNIPCWGDRHSVVLDYITRHVLSGGADGVLVVPQGAPFPRFSEVWNALTCLERDQVKVLTTPVSA